MDLRWRYHTVMITMESSFRRGFLSVTSKRSFTRPPFSFTKVISFAPQPSCTLKIRGASKLAKIALAHQSSRKTFCQHSGRECHLREDYRKKERRELGWNPLAHVPMNWSGSSGGYEVIKGAYCFSRINNYCKPRPFLFEAN